jgi:hypothetical protein
MAQVMVAVGVGGVVCWLATALLLRRRPRLTSSNPDAVPRDPSREEDRVRPAVTVSGERIWIDPGEAVWHEIVAWPERKINSSGIALRRPA